jgi:hypothetical protein
MRGLDPCIYLLETMDCRVKPGNDEGECIARLLHRLFYHHTRRHHPRVERGDLRC